MASRVLLTGLGGLLLAVSAWLAPPAVRATTCEELRARAAPRHEAREIWESEPGLEAGDLASRVGVSKKQAVTWVRRWRSAARGAEESDCKLYPAGGPFEENGAAEAVEAQARFERHLTDAERAACAPGLEACRFRIVDCRLPPTLRRLGRQMPAITPHRWVRTTAGECKKKRGKFFLEEPAANIRLEDVEEPQPALDVTLAVLGADGSLRRLPRTEQDPPAAPAEQAPATDAPRSAAAGRADDAQTRRWEREANRGSACAQNYLGEIHRRRGDYAEARARFEQAAEQGYTEALLNLGALYENGWGVTPKPVAALACYEAATGLKMALDGEKLTDEMRSSAGPQLRLKRPVIVLASPRLRGRQSVPVPPDVLSEKRLELSGTVYQNADLEAFEVNGFDWLDKLRDGRFVGSLELDGDGAEVEVRVTDVQRSEDRVEFSVTGGSAQAGSSARSSSASSTGKAGGYYALLIGNQTYDNHPGVKNLRTPRRDTKDLAEVLESRWGFETELVQDADLAGILGAFDRMRRRVGPDDSLLIYYAGHGEFLTAGGDREGFWLPKDALARPRRPDPASIRNSVESWLSSWEIARQVELMRAKNILVMADSCYAGIWSQSSIPEGGSGGRSVTVLTSGDEREVLDSVAGSGNSLFADVLLEALAKWEGPLAEDELWFEVRDAFARRLEAASREQAVPPGYEQTPTYSPELSGGHKGGKLVLRPTAPPVSR